MVVTFQVINANPPRQGPWEGNPPCPRRYTLISRDRDLSKTFSTIALMNAIPPNTLLRMALLFYMPMLTGVFILKPPGVLQVEDRMALSAWLAVALVIGMAVVGFSRWVGRHTRWGSRLRREFRSLLGPLDARHILWLAVISSVGEEILFRGVLQPRIGLWWSAALFGIMHFPYKTRMLPWTLFAGVLGVVLAWLTELSGSLWPAILLHFFINHYNLRDIMAEDLGKDTQFKEGPPLE